MNLIKKLSITLAITSMVTLCSCNLDDNKARLTATVASNAKAGINNIIYIIPETSNEDYYVSFLGHFDLGINYKEDLSRLEFESYNSHKDYRITYKISKEDYEKIIYICSKESQTIDYILSKNIDTINKIINDYESIDIKDLKVNPDYFHNELPEDFYYIQDIN